MCTRKESFKIVHSYRKEQKKKVQLSVVQQFSEKKKIGYLEKYLFPPFRQREVGKLCTVCSFLPFLVFLRVQNFKFPPPTPL